MQGCQARSIGNWNGFEYCTAHVPSAVANAPARDIGKEMHDAHAVRYSKDCPHCEDALINIPHNPTLHYVNTRLPYAEELGVELKADLENRLVRMRLKDSNKGFTAHLIEAGYDELDQRLSDLVSKKGQSVRQFESGATRDTDAGKIDYQGFLSHEVLRKYGEYMLRHQKQADGQLRASDNWKKGIPRDAYIKSMYRHMMEVVALHEKEPSAIGTGEGGWEDHANKMDEALNALLFNVMGYSYEREMGR